MAKLPNWLSRLRPSWRDAFVLTLGGAIVWTATHWYHDHRRPDANEWEALGTWATFFAAVVGFTRWQTKHNHEKIAAAALVAIPATAELTDAVRRPTTHRAYAAGDASF